MHNNAQMQRENIQVTQACSAPSSSPSSPLASPGAVLSTSFCLPSSGNLCPIINTGDPNWQATKSTVRERNAAMFNNELMADISFIVGSDGKLRCYCFFRFVSFITILCMFLLIVESLVCKENLYIECVCNNKMSQRLCFDDFIPLYSCL